MFVDRIGLKLIAGKGGNGIVAWRREKYIPKGGPTGGNGGRGGSIVFVADSQIYSLEDFKYRRLLKAEDGRSGGANQRQGRQGQDLMLRVPCGTLVKDEETGELLQDLTENGQTFVVCEGGHGGRGNASFKTPTNRAPNKATPGREGVARRIELELKLIADVGLVGFPNAGKSTLIQALTHVRVKVAPYPFTTLRPNIGYLLYDDYQRLLLADIPGIIAGAHENRGLGLEFLRHIERTRGLLYVLDCSGWEGRHPWDDFQVLRNEVRAYSEEVWEKPFFVALNKADCEDAPRLMAEFREKYPYDPETLFEVSALAGTGMQKLALALKRFVPVNLPS